MPEYTLWPAYFDRELPRSEGREVSKDDAVDNPTVTEIANAVQQIGYDATIDRDATFPQEHKQRGRVLVKTDDKKNDVIHAVAAYIDILRD